LEFNNIIRHVIHPFKPIIDPSCKVIILGSVPSIKTIEFGFPYANPHNRFWKILSQHCQCEFYDLDLDKKRSILLQNNIAMFDAIKECDICGSADSSVKNIVPTNVDELIRDTNIKKVLCNGSLSYNIVNKYNNLYGIECKKMPSTSPANATISYQNLKNIWLYELN